MLNSSRAVFLNRWFPLLMWMVIIFLFSTDSFSAGETSRYFDPLMRGLFPGISENALAFWHAVMRKAGHVSEYFVLALLTFRALRRSLNRPMALTMALVVAMALSDEWHQTFTAFRTGSVRDVGFDCAGALLALGVLRLLAKMPIRRTV